ncbi:MAG: thiamine pyrophosphate-dependent dehydrogenase E1 component subunit alpha [Anaerolineales bacterium]|nr:thiamine pyrophosphate-dependent dehydrogenase E1 component subunit alpha [Anaerolineales bacterium]
MLATAPERAGLDDEQLRGMYQRMLTIRQFEDRVKYESSAGNVLGPTHLYIGEEAIAVGVCTALRPDDYITSTHRGHGHAIAKGCQPRRMMAELFGRETGVCHGRGGSMHIADFSVGMLGANAIVAGGIPLATGVGLAIQLKQTDQVIAGFFGESASNRGPFHEGLNMSAVWHLPVLFVCENNQFGQYTYASQVMLIENVSDRAAAYGMPGLTVDGNDVLAVYQAAREAIARLRRGDGPVLLECKTYRMEGHNIGDELYYRRPGEQESWKAKDPIARLRDCLQDWGALTAAQDAEIIADVQAEIEEAVSFAAASPYASTDTIYDDVFSSDYQVTP